MAGRGGRPGPPAGPGTVRRPAQADLVAPRGLRLHLLLPACGPCVRVRACGSVLRAGPQGKGPCVRACMRVRRAVRARVRVSVSRAGLRAQSAPGRPGRRVRCRGREGHDGRPASAQPTAWGLLTTTGMHHQPVRGGSVRALPAFSMVDVRPRPPRDPRRPCRVPRLATQGSTPRSLGAHESPRVP